MKLCFVGNASSIHIHKWVNWFADRGHEIFLASIYRYTDNNPNVKLISLKRQMPVNAVENKIKSRKVIAYASLFYKIRKFLRNNDIDILHGHYITGHGAIASVMPFKHKILSIWGDDIATAPDKYPFIVKLALKNATILHVQDVIMKKKVKELLGENEKIFVMPWGIDLDSFSLNKKSINIRDKIQRLPGPVIIIVRRMEKKYFETLSKAIDRIIEKKQNVNFIISKSEQMKNKYEDNKNVTLIDWIPNQNLSLYFANSDLFIDPYYPMKINEMGHTYGMALLEAMASGIPTLVAERPTIKCLKGVNHWYYGATYHGGDYKELYKKVISLLEEDNNRKKMIYNNLKIVREKFDINKNMGKIEELYQSLI